MASKREASHILSIQPEEVAEKAIQLDTVIDCLLEQRKRLLIMLEQIESDLQSLGYTDESKA